MSDRNLEEKLLSDIQEKFGSNVRGATFSYGMPVLVIDPSIHVELPRWLKAHPEYKFDHFIDITSVDYSGSRETRFDVVVHIRSNSTNLKVRIKTPVETVEAGDPALPTLSDVFIGASWPEREIFDLMGIRFTGHPRMTRILNPDDYVGHPLRKDFPVKGPHRGSFPKGTIISNKRRDASNYKITKPVPADQILPNTPIEQRREPFRDHENKA